MPPMKPEYVRAFRELEELTRSAGQKMMRSYDAAVTDNYNADFKGTFLGANAEILTGKYTARSRARTLGKDDPHGKAVLRTFADNVVGDDPFELEVAVPRSASAGNLKRKTDGSFEKDEELSSAIQSAWVEWCKKENFTTRRQWGFMEACRVIEMSRAREGSILMRLYRGYEFNEFGFAVDLLEEDRLQESYMGYSPANGLFGAGNPIRFSIERHPKYNFALAYWLLTRHPGDVFGRSPMEQNTASNWREQVPAEDIIHFNNLCDRAEQDIGMTELDATIQPLWRNRQYDKSLVLAAIASCMKPFILEKKFPTGMQLPAEMMEQILNGSGVGGPMAPAPTGNGDVSASQQNIGTPAQLLRPGMERELPQGYEAKILDPKFPVEAAHEFRLDNLRDIAVGTGVSYQHISGDFQNLGFIAGLMCQQPFHRNMRVRQNSFIEDLHRLFREWLIAASVSGYFEKYHNLTVPMARIPEICRHARFKGQQWEFVNPLVEAQTLILLHQAGHLTRQQVQDRLPQGQNVETLFRQLEAEQNSAEDHELTFGMDPNAQEPTSDAPDTGDNGKAPAKSKPQRPGVNRGAGRIPAHVMGLIAESSNGHH